MTMMASAKKLSKLNRLLLRCGFVMLLVYLSWLSMMGLHEFGHVLHAWLSGGHVSSVHFGLFEFSETELSSDPHLQFVAWGGPIWGCLIPLIVYGLVVKLRVLRLERLCCFFAGFCLIANGGYIGIGWIDGVGDAGTLLRHGASPWALALSGLAAMAGGLYLWHRLGPGFGLAPAPLSAGKDEHDKAR
jgi:hypothetical protein